MEKASEVILKTKQTLRGVHLDIVTLEKASQDDKEALQTLEEVERVSPGFPHRLFLFSVMHVFLKYLPKIFCRCRYKNVLTGSAPTWCSS